MPYFFAVNLIMLLTFEKNHPNLTYQRSLLVIENVLLIWRDNDEIDDLLY